MCGIAGIFSLGGREVERAPLEAMCAAMAHRGPDDEGIVVEPAAGLGMRRLAIIGVANGRQPVANEDGSVVLVMNGELYNYRELRRDLEARGHRFSTESDTEVAVHLYEEEGEEFFSRLRGMFAFALYDRRRGRLVLGRDRAGKKPLYWARHGGLLAFASEIKALHASGLVPKDLNQGGLRSYLAHGFVAGEETLFAGVRKLGPGMRLVAARGDVRVDDWAGCPDPTGVPASFDEAATRLRDLLDDAVRVRLMSEVPLGAFLSGGVDSAAVVALMRRHLERPVQTFSVGFADDGVDEVVAARETARVLGTSHHDVLVSDCPATLLREVNWHQDEPAGDPAAVPTLCLSRFARRHVTVVLTGEGGDEAFGGYRHYVLGRLVQIADRRVPGLRTAARLAQGLEPVLGRRLPRRLWKAVWLASLSDDDRLRGWLSAFTDGELGALLAPLDGGHDGRDVYGALPPGTDPERFVRRLMWLDARLGLAEGLLMKVDKMSMAASLEARCPLLDQHVIAFAAGLPLAMKLGGEGTKLVLRRAVEGLLPDAVLRRPKHGFDVPLRRWLLNDLAADADALLLSDQAPIRGVLDLEPVRAMWGVLRRRPDELVARQLWLLLNLAIWHEQHWPSGRHAVEARP
jgi:asparagine synthase (glutamine-hydrolysing)